MVSQIGETGPELPKCAGGWEGMWGFWEAVISDLDPTFWLHVQEEDGEYLQDRASLAPAHHIPREARQDRLH